MKSGSSTSLGELIARCLEGDDAAWHRLVDYIAPVVFSLCKKSRLTRDESFDIYGQVSLQMISSLPMINDPGALLSFVATITRRRIYTFYQKIQLDEHLDEEFIAALPDEKSKSPEQDYDLTSRREILEEAMLTLSERDYKLIQALFFDPKEPSYKEIAERLDMPVSSIGPIRGKILAKLHRVLKQKRFKF